MITIEVPAVEFGALQGEAPRLIPPEQVKKASHICPGVMSGYLASARFAQLWFLPHGGGVLSILYKHNLYTVSCYSTQSSNNNNVMYQFVNVAFLRSIMSSLAHPNLKYPFKQITLAYRNAIRRNITVCIILLSYSNIMVSIR